MRGRRGFTPAELAWAMRLRKDGKAWMHIAQSLGRLCGKGIRRQLDDGFRVRRNAYHAKYRRKRRAGRSEK